MITIVYGQSWKFKIKFQDKILTFLHGCSGKHPNLYAEVPANVWKLIP